jgi:phosphatidate cytidylyltransferase
MFGKHQLTPLSPKKTWEGYIGALFTTLLWSYCFSEFLVGYEFMLCPVNQINFIPFNIFNMKCDTSKFTKIYNVMWEIPIIGKITFNLKNIHFHSAAMAMFSSLVAPLGGLFASAFKRSLKIKDFADTIPGHGGLTDRMDCQLLNGVFTTVWLYQFVFYDEKKIIYNLYKKIDKMSYEQKEYIYDFLKKNLRF